MRENTSSFDIRSLMDSIGQSVRTVADSMSQSVKPANVWTESGLRHAMLRALVDGPKTGHDVMTTIEESHEWGVRPTAAKVYPLLESFVDEKLVSVSVVKDRKTYALTKAGKTHVESLEKAAGSSHSESGDARSSNWAEFPTELTTASRRLAKVAFDVAQHGTKEQRDAATAAIDDARRKIHDILSAS